MSSIFLCVLVPWAIFVLAVPLFPRFLVSSFPSGGAPLSTTLLRTMLIFIYIKDDFQDPKATRVSQRLNKGKKKVPLSPAPKGQASKVKAPMSESEESEEERLRKGRKKSKKDNKEEERKEEESEVEKKAMEERKKEKGKGRKTSNKEKKKEDSEEEETKKGDDDKRVTKKNTKSLEVEVRGGMRKAKTKNHKKMDEEFEVIEQAAKKANMKPEAFVAFLVKKYNPLLEKINKHKLEPSGMCIS